VTKNSPKSTAAPRASRTGTGGRGTATRRRVTGGPCQVGAGASSSRPPEASDVTAIPARTTTSPVMATGPGEPPLARSNTIGSTAPLEAMGARIAACPVARAW
jgi:hypothetical protein